MDESNVRPFKKARKASDNSDGYEQLGTYIREMGYDPGSFQANGEIHRFAHDGKKDLGWLIAWENLRVKDGRPYLYCVFGNWREDTRHEFSTISMRPEDKRVLKERFAKTKPKIDSERDQKQRDHQQEVKRRYDLSDRDGNTTYLERKGLQGLFGARRSGDTLLIPMFNVEGDYRGLQTIKGDGKKHFEWGSQKKAAFFRIDGEGPVTYICEGFATGATINMVSGSPVLVAFDKGNLVAVAEAYMAKHSDAELYVCGDDDRQKELEGKPNAGRLAATKAAMVCRTAPIFPVFSIEGRGSDFNDLYIYEGEDAVSRSLGNLPEIDYDYRSLGHSRGMKDIFVYLPKSRDLLTIPIARFKKTELYIIAPESYWLERYPKDKGGFDVDTAQSDLIRENIERGPFDPKKVRYEGVWKDGQKLIVNTGHKLYADGIPTKNSSLKTDHAYLSGSAPFPCDLTNPATIEDCRPMLHLANLINWQDKALAAKIICGWIAVARLGGALDIRPHVWITAPKDAGKTTVLSGLAARCLGSANGRLSALAASTEAGIRQALNGRAIPCIMDEFETNDDERSINIKSGVLNYLRGSWKNVENKQFKGTTHGEAMSFEMNTPFLLASIRTSVVNDADLSRISFLEILPHTNDESMRSKIEAALAAIPDGFGDRLFARQIKNASKIQKSFIVLKRVIAQEGKVSRLSEQLGMLLAGYHSLVSDEAITEEEALAAIAGIELQAMASDGIVADELQCLQHLMGTQVHLPMLNYSDTVESLLEQIEEHPNRKADIIGGLKSFGLLYNVETKILKVADGHTQMKKIYAGTPWAKTWGRSLIRLKGAKALSPHRHLGDSYKSSYRCTAVDLNVLSESSSTSVS